MSEERELCPSDMLYDGSLGYIDNPNTKRNGIPSLRAVMAMVEPPVSFEMAPR